MAFAPCPRSKTGRKSVSPGPKVESQQWQCTSSAMGTGVKPVMTQPSVPQWLASDSMAARTASERLPPYIRMASSSNKPMVSSSRVKLILRMCVYKYTPLMPRVYFPTCLIKIKNCLYI